MTTVYGIDLGTTYSCIAKVDEFERPHVVVDPDSQLMTVPSVVFFESHSNVVVGKRAREEAALQPERVVTLVKRHMGDPSWRFRLDGKDYSASQVSEFILRALCRYAQEADGAPVERVIITVPAYFGDEERKATEWAGRLAGLEVVDIINEPTAAAFAYGFAQQGSAADESVLVYDLGGGTFDVTVIDLAKERITVVATAGNQQLGGADIDRRIADLLKVKAKEVMGAHDSGYSEAEEDNVLLEAAEDAKRDLSLKEAIDVRLSLGRLVKVRLTRDEVEELADAIVEQTLDLTQRVIEAAAKRGVAKIDRLLLVGGASRMPLIASRLEERFRLEPKLADPDLAVAKGAAIFAHKKDLERLVRDRLDVPETVDLNTIPPSTLQNVVKNVINGTAMDLPTAVSMVKTKVTNVCSRGFGVFALKSPDSDSLYAHFLAHQNDTLPLERQETFATVIDDQPEVHFPVFEQGGSVESERTEDNNVLGEGYIKDIPAGFPAGTEIAVKFSMSESGMITLEAVHAGHGQKMRLELQTKQARSAAELEKQKKVADSVSVTVH